ncbi:type II toxin-antitoxin system RelE family toxin [Streptomyces glaucescens]|uniref:type II toxin-antitoxin system RelE family toxin n=1 Tax=Streptomyces glaucescens TaxID=1907 RepID=UPI00399B6540
MTTDDERPASYTLKRSMHHRAPPCGNAVPKVSIQHLSSTVRGHPAHPARHNPLNSTALESQPERRRLRVGDYRVVYTSDGGELVAWALHVGHRSTVHDT